MANESITSRIRNTRTHKMACGGLYGGNLVVATIAIFALFASDVSLPGVDAFSVEKLIFKKPAVANFIARPIVKKLLLSQYSTNPIRNRSRKKISALFSNNDNDDENQVQINGNHVPVNGQHTHSGRRSGVSGLLSKVISRKNNIDDNEILTVDPEEYRRLVRENQRLKETLDDLEEENKLLHYEVSSRIVLENFEGEGKIRRFAEMQEKRAHESLIESGMTIFGEEMFAQDVAKDFDEDQDGNDMWCDELEDGQCPIEPTVSFGEALRDRAYWLVGLLVLQSCSGIILARNEALLANHPVIIYFLTMLVGAGGNAGNQASVRVIRGLALGTLNENTQGQFLMRELKMASALSIILSSAGFIRAIAFQTPLPETIAITSALFMIVFSSVCLGAVLPLILKKLKADPAHSSTTIQVIMDILGVVLAVVVSGLLLDNPIGQYVISKLCGCEM